MIQVDLIRGRILRALREVGIYISCLPMREQTALERLSGEQGQKTYANITDFILTELGHEPPNQKNQSFTPSYRQAKNFAPTLTLPEIIDYTAEIEKNNKLPLELIPKTKGWPKGKKRKVAAEAVINTSVA